MLKLPWVYTPTVTNQLHQVIFLTPLVVTPLVSIPGTRVLDPKIAGPCLHIVDSNRSDCINRALDLRFRVRKQANEQKSKVLNTQVAVSPPLDDGATQKNTSTGTADQRYATLRVNL